MMIGLLKLIGLAVGFIVLFTAGFTSYSEKDTGSKPKRILMWIVFIICLIIAAKLWLPGLFSGIADLFYSIADLFSIFGN